MRETDIVAAAGSSLILIMAAALIVHFVVREGTQMAPRFPAPWSGLR
jgi:hypothetical protein